MLVISRFKSLMVWLRRCGHSCGFGIQSPIDYGFVRYVINEHWCYYAYSRVGKGDDWQRRKLGRLYFRIANWRQPHVVESSDYHDYLKAACKNIVFGESSELIIISLEGTGKDVICDIYNKVNEQSVLVVEGIYTDKKSRLLWNDIIEDNRTGVTFDLYYCGIVFFDNKRFKRNYIINF